MHSRDANRRHRGRPRRIGPALVGLAVVAAGTAWWLSGHDGPDVTASARPVAAPVGVTISYPVVPQDSGTAADTGPAAVLRAWDRARADAYARGSEEALRDLYVAGAGERDVRVLRSYLSRGYRVEDMQMQVLDIAVVDRRPGEWRLRVTDRLAAAVAVGHGERVRLPRDRAASREVTLERGDDGRWRVSSVSA